MTARTSRRFRHVWSACKLVCVQFCTFDHPRTLREKQCFTRIGALVLFEESCGYKYNPDRLFVVVVTLYSPSITVTL